MKSPYDLREKLLACSTLSGLRDVYVQPPESKTLSYPCGVLVLEGVNRRKADNKNYKYDGQYTLTVMAKDPEFLDPEELENELDYCRFDRPFPMDNLNHWVFTIYY